MERLPIYKKAMITITTLTDMQVLLISVAALAACLLIGLAIEYFLSRRSR